MNDTDNIRDILDMIDDEVAYSEKYTWYMNGVVRKALNTPAIKVSYKGKTKTDTAAFYAPYIPLMSENDEQ